MMDLVTLALSIVGSVAKIAAEAIANAQAAEVDALARLKVVLAGAIVKVDARLGELDAARASADARIEAAGPHAVTEAAVTLPVPTGG